MECVSACERRADQTARTIHLFRSLPPVSLHTVERIAGYAHTPAADCVTALIFLSLRGPKII